MKDEKFNTQIKMKYTDRNIARKHAKMKLIILKIDKRGEVQHPNRYEIYKIKIINLPLIHQMFLQIQIQFCVLLGVVAIKAI
jgi:hypothetical protein